MSTTLIGLLVIYQVKHFLCDYPLQNSYMMGKFKDDWTYVKPLLAHAGVHALATFLIVFSFLLWTPGGFVYALLAGLFDLAIHFVVDRIKASPKLLGRFVALSKNDFIMHYDIIGQYMNFLGRVDRKTEAGRKNSLEVSAQMDRLEAEWIEKNKSNQYFWWALGWDQMMHHLTHYLIIWFVLEKMV